MTEEMVSTTAALVTTTLLSTQMISATALSTQPLFSTPVGRSSRLLLFGDVCPKKSQEPYSELMRWTPFEADANRYNGRRSHLYPEQGALCKDLYQCRGIAQEVCKEEEEEDMDLYSCGCAAGVPQDEMLQVLHTGLYSVIAGMRCMENIVVQFM